MKTRGPVTMKTLFCQNASSETVSLTVLLMREFLFVEYET